MCAGSLVSRCWFPGHFSQTVSIWQVKLSNWCLKPSILHALCLHFGTCTLGGHGAIQVHLIPRNQTFGSGLAFPLICGFRNFFLQASWTLWIDICVFLRAVFPVTFFQGSGGVWGSKNKHCCVRGVVKTNCSLDDSSWPPVCAPGFFRAFWDQLVPNWPQRPMWGVGKPMGKQGNARARSTPSLHDCG